MTRTNKKYEANGVLKMSEEDNYKEGCLINTGNSFTIDQSFKSDSIEGIIKECMNFVGVDSMDACLLDSCEEEGRLDIQTLENHEGYNATDIEIKKWKKGLIRLWSVTYYFQIELVNREKVSLLKAVSK